MTSSAVPFPYDKEEQDVIEAMKYGPQTQAVGNGLSNEGYGKLIDAGLADNPVVIERRLFGVYANEAEAKEATLEFYRGTAKFCPISWPDLLESKFVALAPLDDGRVVAYIPRRFSVPEEEFS